MVEAGVQSIEKNQSDDSSEYCSNEEFSDTTTTDKSDSDIEA